MQLRKLEKNDELAIKTVHEQKKSIMKKESMNELTINRKYLPETLGADLLETSKDDGLPILKPFVILYLSSKGILTEF